MKKVLNFILGFILIALLIYIVIAIYCKITGNTLGIGKYHVYQVATGSMVEELNVGDYILVKQTDEYKVGDIVTYIDEEGNCITHRILTIADGIYTTKGDANTGKDKSIAKTQIVGKYIKKVNNYKELINFLSNKWIIISLILMVIIINLFPNYNPKKVKENESQVLTRKEK